MSYVLIMLLWFGASNPVPITAEFDSLSACRNAASKVEAAYPTEDVRAVCVPKS